MKHPDPTPAGRNQPRTGRRGASWNPGTGKIIRGIGGA
jgi:hypothetical protein